jgi:hypothetical protein
MESRLPDRPVESKLTPNLVRRTALNHLQRFLKCRIAARRKEQMQVIGHQNNCMQFVKTSIRDSPRADEQQALLGQAAETTHAAARCGSLRSKRRPDERDVRFDSRPEPSGAKAHFAALRDVAPKGATHKPFGTRLLPLRLLQDVCLHRIKSVRRVREPLRRKMLFKLVQERVTHRFGCKFNCHAALIVGRGGRRRAKLAAAQSTQPR